MENFLLKDLGHLFRTMSQGLKDGLSMEHALNRGQISCGNPRLREAMGIIIQHWDRDGGIVKAMERYPELFQPAIIEITQIGLNEGSLVTVWEKASEAYFQMAEKSDQPEPDAPPSREASDPQE